MPAIHFIGFEDSEVSELIPPIREILIDMGVADVASWVSHPDVTVRNVLSMERAPYIQVGGSQPGLPERVAKAIQAKLPELAIEFETHGFLPGTK